jgi:hypothetical protein
MQQACDYRRLVALKTNGYLFQLFNKNVQTSAFQIRLFVLVPL